MSATQKRILITGANKGIGCATSGAVLAASDEPHVLLGSRSLERGEAARAELVAQNPGWASRIRVLGIDVSDDLSVSEAAQTVAAWFEGEAHPLFGLVNNAGIGLGSAEMQTVLNVNTHGPRRVCEAFIGLLDPGQGRIVNVSSASGTMFVAACSEERQRMLTSPDVTWQQIEALMHEALALEAARGDFASAGLGDGSAYGFSKACLNAYTIALARQHPNLTINACTPGFIETDLTRPFAESRGMDPKAMGMKSPEEGTKATLHLLLGELSGSGWYFGSDAQRSPLDRYRAPGDPPYQGE
ncbi:MAG: SDR family NAD(P)-dependent oxidoreductase [Bradymonadaceae bacterium]|nr:SDR family NAD(P)-dependent oxidoreductase [Lujinxingiaceae bacterium]